MSEFACAVLTELRAALERVYGRRLQGLYLYGSYARGEQQPDSDLDVLIVLDRIDRYGAEIDRTSELTSNLSLKYTVSISRVFVPEQDWVRSESSFLAEVRQEAIAA